MDDSTTERSYEKSKQEILADHRQLSEILGRIQRVAVPTEIPRLLGSLREVLPRHFAREQGPDGLFDMIEERAPQHEKTVLLLLEEHRSFTTELAELIARSSRSVGAGLIEAADAFAARLRRHERRESELLMDVLSSGPEQRG